MSKLIKLEELGQFLFVIFLFNDLDYAWWVFLVCILLPDISMLGYLINTKVGAFSYNLFHHKLIAITILILGFYIHSQLITLVGIILWGHSAMDRCLGYGLKYKDSFQHTHLGTIGKDKQQHL